MDRFVSLGVVKNSTNIPSEKLDYFLSKIETMKNEENWSKQDLVDLIHDMLPDFGHKETGKYLDGKM